MSHVVHPVALPELPPARDFLMSAGFEGVATLLAAVIVLSAVMVGSRRAGKRSLAEREQRDRHHEERRTDEQHAAAVARCWDRWWQLLETAEIEPSASEGATLGLGPEVALELLRGLLRDAEQLGDETLTKAIAVYQEQLLLVLVQQSGPLSALAKESGALSVNGALITSTRRDTSASADHGSASTGAPEQRRQAEVESTAPDSMIAATSSPVPAEATTGRRRRR
ncbi:hypothetical protein ACORG1_33480 (plasmid) [Mycobacterium sp. TJFP1]